MSGRSATRADTHPGVEIDDVWPAAALFSLALTVEAVVLSAPFLFLAAATVGLTALGAAAEARYDWGALGLGCPVSD